METIRVGVVGATGKMGREILKAVTNDPATEVIFGVGLVDEPTTITVEGREIPVTADLDAALSANDVDVVIDFTTPTLPPECERDAKPRCASGERHTSSSTKNSSWEKEACQPWQNASFYAGKFRHSARC